MIRKFTYLPKDAVPQDKQSFVGTAPFSGATSSFRFVYRKGKRWYIIQCFGGFGAKISKYVTTKDLFIDDDYEESLVTNE